MGEVVDAFLTFVRDYLPVVLGIMALGVLYLVLNRELTIQCPNDGKPMNKVDDTTWNCPKCDEIKRV